MVHGIEHFPHDCIRDLLQDIGNIVVVEALGDQADFLGVHVGEEVSLQIVGQFADDLALLLDVHQLPQDVAGPWRRGFQQVGDLCRGEAVEHVPHIHQCTAVEQL